MKAITIHQPYATLIALGLKRYETRTWDTTHRGPLAIHAAKRIRRTHNIPGHEIVWHEQSGLYYLRRLDSTLTPVPLPLGAVVATCDLVATGRATLVSNTDPFGIYEPGWFAWRLGNVKLIDPPIPVRGRQGLWNWEAANG